MNYRRVAVCFRRHFFKVFSTFCIYILCVSVLFFSITKVLKWRFVCLEPDDRLPVFGIVFCVLLSMNSDRHPDGVFYFLFVFFFEGMLIYRDIGFFSFRVQE